MYLIIAMSKDVNLVVCRLITCMPLVTDLLHDLDQFLWQYLGYYLTLTIT